MQTPPYEAVEAPASTPSASEESIEPEKIVITAVEPAAAPWNSAYPPLKVPFSIAYVMLPAKRRGCVGMREIGTEHGPLDVLLCACLGTPGIVYAITAVHEPLWLRVLVAIEFSVVGAASVVADGLLARQSTDDSNRDGLLKVDRVTSAVHIPFLAAMFIYRGAAGHASPAQLAIAVGLAVLSLATFHARLYYTFVEQRWRPARLCARLWHVGGMVAPLLGLLPRFL